MTEGKRNSCPTCGSIRVKKHGDDIYYTCERCGWTGNTVKKILWFFGIPNMGGGPPIGRSKAVTIRERSFCPSCQSVRVRKRVHTHDYYCENCKWIGTVPKRMKWGSVATC